MNTALLLFDGLFIIPVLQVFRTFFAIVGTSTQGHAQRSLHADRRKSLEAMRLG